LPGGVKCSGTEGEIVVAHGRLPSPAHQTSISYSNEVPSAKQV